MNYNIANIMALNEISVYKQTDITIAVAIDENRNYGKSEAYFKVYVPPYTGQAKSGTPCARVKLTAPEYVIHKNHNPLNRKQKILLNECMNKIANNGKFKNSNKTTYQALVDQYNALPQLQDNPIVYSEQPDYTKLE